MKTDDLIKGLAADASVSAMPMGRAWLLALAAAATIAGAVFFATIGLRPDIVDAAETVRFVFKPVVTIVLALTAFMALLVLSRPASDGGVAISRLAVVPLLLLGAVALELVVIPAGQWSARLIGTNAVVCLTYIPLIGIGPLAVFLLVLRHGAPTHPVLAGTAAGLLAGGIAATFYAMHCTDDSPLFVATWYTVAIVGLAALGALAAPRIARW